MLSLMDAWRRRWAGVFGIDLRTLALFRVALSSVLLVNLVLWLGDARAFYTDWGVLPRDWLIRFDSEWRLSLHLISGDLWFFLLLHALIIAAAAALWLGYRTRLATVALFVLMGSLQNRNPMVLIGGDGLIMCLLFWSLFLPLGARWSVDAALSSRAPPRNNLHVSWASAGLLIQVMSVYFFSAILKNGGDWWPDGLAVYYTLSLTRYSTPLGQQLLHFPHLMQALSYYVYFLEWIGPVLVFVPWFSRALRLIVMLGLTAMHIGFILCLEIGHFPYVSLASLTVLLGGWFWDAARRRLDHGRRTRIYYDRDCGFCLKMCDLLREFLVLPHVEIEPAQDHPRPRALMEAHFSWVVIDAEDRAHLKWPAFVALLRDSLLSGWLWRLAALRVLVKPCNAVYDFVGRHRDAFSAVTARHLPRNQVRFETGRAAQIIAGVFVVLVFAWNLATVKVLPDGVIQALRPPFRLLRIDQFWNMFAPYPSRANGWVVFPGVLEDGSEVDVLRPGQPLSWDKPRYISRTHENVRWHTYRWRIWEKQYADNRLYYGRYLCRDWNSKAPPGKRLVSFKMVWLEEFTLPPGQTPRVEQSIGWRHQCVPPEFVKKETAGDDREPH